MTVGVHGTPEIDLLNPLNDRDISDMFAYLLTTPWKVRITRSESPAGWRIATKILSLYVSEQ